MSIQIQDLTNEELQEAIDLYQPAMEHNIILQQIVYLYQKELNERED
jgi:hypothetical protein